jgi:hypothetical protein
LRIRGVSFCDASMGCRTDVRYNRVRMAGYFEVRYSRRVCVEVVALAFLPKELWSRVDAMEDSIREKAVRKWAAL